ncbi:hypothetical protein C7H09_18460 [Marinobacter fuscus]|uniref:Glucosamine/galactosamine-6-phosphate isomerase domain-containing protein n=1 Tax=Marinobacter fuscus TaxID=2109942 RepID=A0A2T1K497_9GAMM|nr:6-phosphogluconolactonase [Marinobacter fuscus]PSF04994.1 hypothetical protein C7H09_18460 [Marinobacter fuscus]
MKMPEIDLPEGVLGCFHSRAEQVAEDLAARVATLLRGRLAQSHPRVSLSRAFLAGARFTALHLRGDDKLETLRAACQAPENEMAMPVRAFLKSGLRVFWSP